MSVPFRIRGACAGDAPFILNSWLRSYHEHGEGARHVPNDVFFADSGHHGVVTRLIGRSRTLVACSVDDDDAIFGWVCAEPFDLSPPGDGALHYVYVKQVYRKLGLGQVLLRQLGFPLTVATHWTPVMRTWRERGRHYSYNPYLAVGGVP